MKIRVWLNISRRVASGVTAIIAIVTGPCLNVRAQAGYLFLEIIANILLN